jgi:Sulfotransferase family
VSESRRAPNLRLLAARRAFRRSGFRIQRLGRLDDRLVFVLGSPRSGTTFVGRTLGSLPGFVDLGEVEPLKAAVAELSGLTDDESARRIRRILDGTRRLGVVGGLRGVEQTPGNVFVLAALQQAFPHASFVHVVRDGRDVVSSLLERGWLRAERVGHDGVGQPFGAAPRFWVEPGRRAEFSAVGDARRAAWAWRRHIEAVRASGVAVHEVRYERMCGNAGDVARELSSYLGVPMHPLSRRLARAHVRSVGRWRRDLEDEQLADVLAECGTLLGELGYV